MADLEQDVLQEIRVLRLPGLTEAVDGNLAAQLALVKKIQNRSLADRDSDLAKF